MTYHFDDFSISATSRITITDNALTGLGINSDGPVDVGIPTHFTATLNYGNPITYTWDMGDGTVLFGMQVTHTYTAYGIFTITLTVSDGTTTLQTTLPAGEPLRRIYLPALFVAPPPD